MRAAVLVTVVLLLGLTSCGGDDAEAASAISGSVMKAQQSPSSVVGQLLRLDRAGADCLGKGLVDKIGVDQLKAYHLLTTDLHPTDVETVSMSKGDAEATTAVLFGCTDVSAMIRRILGRAKAPTAVKTCVSTALDDRTLRSMFTALFRGEEEQAKTDLVRKTSTCASLG